MATFEPPKKNTAYRASVMLVDQANTKKFKLSPTLAAGDVKVSIDNAALANLATLPSEAPAGSGIIQVDLSAGEMNGDNISVRFLDAAGAEWCDLYLHLQTTTKQIDDLATQASVDVIDDFLDTEIAAIKAKTDGLPSDPADASDIAAAFASLAAAVNVIDDFLDTEIAAIKAKTDNLPAAPAAVSDIPTATQNADALLNRDMAAVSDTNARSPLNSLRFLRNKRDTASIPGTLIVKKEDDATNAWTAALTSDPAAEPVTIVDPA